MERGEHFKENAIELFLKQYFNVLISQFTLYLGGQQNSAALVPTGSPSTMGLIHKTASSLKQEASLTDSTHVGEGQQQHTGTPLQGSPFHSNDQNLSTAGTLPSHRKRVTSSFKLKRK